MSGEVPLRPLVRPLELADLSGLADLDAAYCAALGAATVVNRASVHFYGRSGHSFVAERPVGSTASRIDHAEAGSVAVGFVLAHSSWSGGGAVVRIERMVAVSKPAGEASLPASSSSAPPLTAASSSAASLTAASLTAAVVKSAYDAGVYRLVAAVPSGDRSMQAALGAGMFEVVPDVTYLRLLGAGALNGSSTVGDRSGGGGEHDR